MAGIPPICHLETTIGIGELLQLSQSGAVNFAGDGSDLLLGQGTVLEVGLGGASTPIRLI